MIPTFDEWMAANCTPSENYTFGQYGKYIEGWRNSLPWARKGMSVAYDNWAESRWEDIQDKQKPTEAWKMGLALTAKSITNTYDKGWLGKTVEEAADFSLTVPDTLAALVFLGMSVQPSNNTEKAADIKPTTPQRLPIGEIMTEKLQNSINKTEK